MLSASVLLMPRCHRILVLLPSLLSSLKGSIYCYSISFLVLLGFVFFWVLFWLVVFLVFGWVFFCLFFLGGVGGWLVVVVVWFFVCFCVCFSLVFWGFFGVGQGE